MWREKTLLGQECQIWLIAFLENHLQADGTVTIPETLRPYMGGKELLVPGK